MKQSGTDRLFVAKLFKVKTKIDKFSSATTGDENSMSDASGIRNEQTVIIWALLVDG